MRKKYLEFGLALIGLLSPLSGYADMEVNFNPTTGETVAYNVADIGKITFIDGKVSVFGTDNTLSWVNGIKETKSITFNMKNSGIASVVEEISTPVFEMRGDVIYLKGVDSAQRGYVYSLGGQLLMQDEIGADKGIDVSSLEKGIYLLRTANLTFKFIK